MTSRTYSVPRGNETILLVEPEPETRKLAAFMLTKQGYCILEARNAAEAVELYDEHGSAVDLLFTEGLMPKTSGRELAASLTARNPGLKVLYLCVSGTRGDRFVKGRQAPVLLWPFTMAVLADKVRQVLDAGERVLRAAGD
jgi:CheY-like chemotaxis protein